MALQIRKHPKPQPKPERDRRVRLLNGQTVPAAQAGRSWQDLVQPAPKPTGGAALDPAHPSRKHDGPLLVREYLVEHEPAAPRWARRNAQRSRVTDARKATRAQTRAALADFAGPQASRAVQRWAERLHAINPAAPALEQAVRTHQDVADWHLERAAQREQQRRAAR